MPKPNMYQSLHSTVIGPQGKPFEIQIRTFEMHKTAEYGIAAHWKYKEGVDTANDIDKKLTWLREILEWQRETSDAEEFMERFKIDLFSDEVFVFTPNGKVINLPYEATPIDFAYKIHTEIGNSCIGAKVSGKMVPLDYHLKTGEIVEVLVSSTPKGPSIDWLNMAKSNQAKSKIRSWFKKAKREENIVKGKDLLEKETKKQGYNFGEIAKKEILDTVLKRYNMNSADDLYASVGIGAVTSSTIVSRIKDIYMKTSKMDEIDWKKIQENLDQPMGKSHKAEKKSPGIIVKGESNVLVRFAKCCNPVPGDDIIGYITKGRGVSIHRKDCKNAEFLLKNKDNMVVEVSWGRPKGAEYIAQIKIEAEDRGKLLAESMEVISNSKTALYAVNAKPVKNGLAVIDIKLKISNVDDLKDVMKKFRKLEGVIQVYRTKN